MGLDTPPVRLLASGRLGQQVSVNRSDRPVFIDPDAQLCCEHGERAMTIQSWLTLERSNPDFKRPSVCDCQNIDGLLTSYPEAQVCLPSAEESLYKVLGEIGSEETRPSSRPQRLALRMSSGAEVWVQPSGTLVCRHGNSRKILARMNQGEKRFRSKGVVKCNCVLTVPRRVGSVFAARSKGSKVNA